MAYAQRHKGVWFARADALRALGARKQRFNQGDDGNLTSGHRSHRQGTRESNIIL